MSVRRTGLALFVGLAVALSSSAAHAEQWRLDNSESSLTYLSLKMSGERSIYENNRFKRIGGALGERGVSITVDLSSLDTKVAIRDERVLKHVFKTAEFPHARITGPKVNVPAVGETSERTVEMQLEIRGAAKPVSARVGVERTSDDTLVVQTIEPVLLDANQWALGEGFEILRDLVKLAHISTTVPVSFRFVFRSN